MAEARTTTQRSRITRGLFEGFVIVVSILLAFSMDAWWGEREESLRRQAHLQLLEAEFVAHLKYLDSLEQELEGMRVAVAALLGHISPDAEAIPPDRLSSLIFHSFRLRPVEIQSGSLQALLASGDLALIEDIHLKSLLASWAADVARLKIQTSVLQENREEIIRYLHDLMPTLNIAQQTNLMGRYPQSSFNTGSEVVLRSLKSEGLFANRGINVEFTALEIITLKGRAVDILKLLKQNNSS